MENLFYLSFLIRDGKCAFFTDEDTGEPVICKFVPLHCTQSTVLIRQTNSLQCCVSSPHKKITRMGCKSISLYWNLT